MRECLKVDLFSKFLSFFLTFFRIQSSFSSRKIIRYSRNVKKWLFFLEPLFIVHSEQFSFWLCLFSSVCFHIYSDPTLQPCRARNPKLVKSCSQKTFPRGWLFLHLPSPVQMRETEQSWSCTEVLSVLTLSDETSDSF